jgi:hypothetical protein
VAISIIIAMNASSKGWDGDSDFPSREEFEALQYYVTEFRLILIAKLNKEIEIVKTS